MKFTEYRFRSVKRGGRIIHKNLTFNSWFLKKLLSSNRTAVLVFISELLNKLNEISNHLIILDTAQKEILENYSLKKCVIYNDIVYNTINDCFKNGITFYDSPSNVLTYIDKFYRMLDCYYLCDNIESEDALGEDIKLCDDQQYLIN